MNQILIWVISIISFYNLNFLSKVSSQNIRSPTTRPQDHIEPKDNMDQLMMYSGYGILGLVILVIMIIKLCKNRKTQEEKADNDDVEANKNIGGASIYESSVKLNSIGLFEFRTSKPEVSTQEEDHGIDQSGLISSPSLIVLTSPSVNGMKFEDLLKAPAELLGRGKYGSLFKVKCENGKSLVVKRIGNWGILSNDFMERMWKIDGVKHRNVLPALGFYSSKEEKLLVYEYQINGSLFRLLHGVQKNQTFEWSKRLNVTSTIAKALAVMHQELGKEGIAHGNLKSSNILFNENMEPCISEYGLLEMNNNEAKSNSSTSFKADVYGFGVILLELLTGKPMQNDGVKLTEWVHSVFREEWTVEVFDKYLISEGVNEERLIKLIHVALKCVNRSPNARPNMNQVSSMIDAINEEEDKSMVEDRSIFWLR